MIFSGWLCEGFHYYLHCGRLSGHFLESSAFSEIPRRRDHFLDWWGAIACDGMDSSLSIDPGIRVCLPNTITSGAYPCRTLSAFLACVHWFKTLWSVVYSWMLCSRSIFTNISWRNRPCLSILPFCQWASGQMVVGFMDMVCMYWENSSLFSSVPESTWISWGAPAQLIQCWLRRWITSWVVCDGAIIATW